MSFAIGALGLWLVLANASEARGQLDAVMRRGDYQRELPTPAGATPQPPGAGRFPMLHRPTLPSMSGAGSLLVFALVITFTLVLVLLLLASVRAHWQGPKLGTSVLRRSAGPRAPPVMPPTDFEELAAQERYGEAVHALLLHALAALAPAPAPPLTAREALRSTRLTGERHAALRALVAEAERFWFGGERALRADFEHCQELWRCVRDGARA